MCGPDPGNGSIGFFSTSHDYRGEHHRRVFTRFFRSLLGRLGDVRSTSEVLSMKPETVGRVKFGVWGLICGAVIAMIIGFAWGGWTTGGTSRQRTEAAVLATRAAICVAQFIKDPNYKEKLKELTALDSYARSDFIQKGGW